MSPFFLGHPLFTVIACHYNSPEKTHDHCSWEIVAQLGMGWLVLAPEDVVDDHDDAEHGDATRHDDDKHLQVKTIYCYVGVFFATEPQKQQSRENDDYF